MLTMQDLPARWTKELAKGPVAVDDELRDYFLNVLPPLAMNCTAYLYRNHEEVRAGFVFAEGEDYPVAFYRTQNGYFAYYCRAYTQAWHDGTTRLRIVAGLPNSPPGYGG